MLFRSSARLRCYRATRDPLAQIVLSDPATAGPLGLGQVDLGQFTICGTLGVAAHTMLAHAFVRIEAAKLAPIGYVTLVWGVLFGFLFFAEVPALTTFAGAALIVVGTLITQKR